MAKAAVFCLNVSSFVSSIKAISAHKDGARRRLAVRLQTLEAVNEIPNGHLDILRAANEKYTEILGFAHEDYPPLHASMGKLSHMVLRHRSKTPAESSDEIPQAHEISPSTSGALHESAG